MFPAIECPNGHDYFIGDVSYMQFIHTLHMHVYVMGGYIRECGSTLYVGMPWKQNGRPIHCIVKSSSQNAAIGKF